MFRSLRERGGHEKVPFGKKVFEMEVWREASLTLAILKNPNMELKQSIETYFIDKQDELSLTDKEFILYVDALLEHATFKGMVWIDHEYEKSRGLKVAKDFLEYGPLDNI